MTDRELLAQCYDTMKVLYIPDAPLLKALKKRLDKPEDEPTIDGWPLWSGLPQQKQEPVAWAKPDDLVNDGYSHAFTVWNPAPGTIDTIPLYISPPQREWKSLTKREFEYAVDGLEDLEDCWTAIEAKLREKNQCF